MSIMVTKIIVHGNPIAKARPKFFRRGNHVGTYNSQETEEGKFLLLVRQHLTDDHPFIGPVTMDCLFIMQRPKNHFGTGRNVGKLKPSAPRSHTKKPDLDNLIKFAKDCLNEEAWKDDAQVTSINACKRYGNKPRTVIILSTHNETFQPKKNES